MKRLALLSLLALPACADPDGTSSANLAAPSARVWIAQVEPGAAPQARASLAAAGLEPLAPLPGGRLLVAAPNDVVASALPAAGVAAWRPWSARDRVAHDLAAASPGPAGRVPVVVHALPGADPDAIADALRAAGHEVVTAGNAGEWPRVVARLEPAAVAAATSLLGARDDVFFVERIRHAGIFNERLVGSAQSGTQGSAAAQTPIWEHGLRGEGQIVGMIDTGLDPDVCAVDDDQLPITNTWSADAGYGTAVDASHRKIIAYDFLFSCDQWPASPGCDADDDPERFDNHGHGTHIIGTIAGDRDESPATYAAPDGLAPAAKVVVQDGGFGIDDCADLPGLGCPILDLTPLYAQAYTQGVRVINNSWGDNENEPAPGQSNYTARTQDVDRFMWEHPDMLIVFAAGNSGGGNRDFSVGSPATMKNGLSVGSARKGTTSTDESISGFSSRGWTGDGRIKPDLMAPGCNVSFATDGTVGAETCSTDGGCGTSYAAPVAVGAAALVRQYFVDGRYAGGALEPTAALVKATLINASIGMTGTDNLGQPITPIPSNEQGWGRIELDRSLAFDDSTFALFVDDHRAPLAAGATDTFHYAFDVEPGVALKVTLAWTDYPGVPDQPPTTPTVGDPASWTDPQLVNDLDLEVELVDGDAFLGNVFANGASATGGVADRRNNVEQVRVAAPTAGRVVVAVKAHDIQVAGQQFALVVTGDVSGAGACTPVTEGTTVLDGVGGAGVAISWTDPANLGSYVVERGDGGCGATAWTALATVSATSHVDATAAAGATYGYRVRGSTIADGACTAATWSCVEATTPPDEIDAGVPDAGPDLDAGIDAGPDIDAAIPDAAPGLDASPPDAATPDARAPDAASPDVDAQQAPDAGDGGGGGGDGCGCRTTSPASAAPLALALLGLFVPRRRRRRLARGSHD